VIAIWTLALTVGFNLLLAYRLHQEADDAVRTRAEAVAATVEFGPSRAISVDEGELGGSLDSGIWVYSGTRAVERPSGNSSLQAVADALVGQGKVHVTSRGRDRLYALPITRVGERVGTVVASVSLAPYKRAQREALLGSILLAALVIFGAYPVLKLGATRALRPVDEMTRQAADWSANDVTQRFGDEQEFRELHFLGATLDDVLDRLSAVIRHERQLTAELSHELRTPLARITAETDLLMARPRTGEQLAAAHRVIHDTAESMQQILDTLLSAARPQTRESPGRCDLRDAFARVASARGEGDQPVVTAVDNGLSTGVEGAVVERILAPVIDNAARHARGSVSVLARRVGGSIVIEVTDDGPGVDQALWQHIFEPGFRGDPDDGHPGAGLGLPLARRLARASEGDVSVVSQHPSTFSITLPPA